jgi:hypothetical protein
MLTRMSLQSPKLANSSTLSVQLAVNSVGSGLLLLIAAAAVLTDLSNPEPAARRPAIVLHDLMGLHLSGE